jgi:hypothetical protein
MQLTHHRYKHSTLERKRDVKLKIRVCGKYLRHLAEPPEPAIRRRPSESVLCFATPEPNGPYRTQGEAQKVADLRNREFRENLPRFGDWRAILAEPLGYGGGPWRVTNTTHEFGEEDDSDSSDDESEFCQVSIPSSPGSFAHPAEVSSLEDQPSGVTVNVESAASRDRPRSTATVK